MDSDNKVFDVNGSGVERLTQTIALAMNGRSKIDGYRIDKKAGIILLWHVDSKVPEHVKFPAPISAAMAAVMVYEWVTSKEAMGVPAKDGWDANADHDGSNEHGWRVYVNDWGHVDLLGGGSERCAIAAIKPAYLWFGK